MKGLVGTVIIGPRHSFPIRIQGLPIFNSHPFLLAGALESLLSLAISDPAVRLCRHSRSSRKCIHPKFYSSVVRFLLLLLLLPSKVLNSKMSIIALGAQRETWLVTFLVCVKNYKHLRRIKKKTLMLYALPSPRVPTAALKLSMVLDRATMPGMPFHTLTADGKKECL